MAELFVSSAIPQLPGGVWVENGTQLVWQYEPVYLMPDNGQMAMNAVIVMNIACGGPDCSSTAPPEATTYTPPSPGGGPIGPGNVPLEPNQPPVPPEQPPQPPPAVLVGPVTNFPGKNGDGGFGAGGAQAFTSNDLTVTTQVGDSFSPSQYAATCTVSAAVVTQLPAGILIPNCMSADGTVIGGMDAASTHGVWLAVGSGVVTILGGGAGFLPCGVNWCADDASIFVGEDGGSGATNRAVYWDKATGTEHFLPQLVGGHITVSAIGCSSDAAVVVGTANGADDFERAVWWDRVGATCTLLATSFATAAGGNIAFACSSDGSIIVGSAQVDAVAGHYQACWWSKATGVLTLLAPPGGGTANGSQAHGVSADGSLIIGTVPGVGAVVWRRLTGVGTILTVPAGYNNTKGICLSADGLLAGGSVHKISDNRSYSAWWSGF